VIGAGLAGSATAYALAQRGWLVTVLEAAPAAFAAATTGARGALPAHGAAPSAGLPVALMAPHQSSAGAAHSAISQLSRLGLIATTHAARALLVKGQDWQPCGALQRAGKLGLQAHWFADAAWVKPAALVAVWLAHPNITVCSAAQVHAVHTAQPAWQATDAQGRVLAQADICVLANAYQAKTLLQRLQEHLGTHAASPQLQRVASSLHQVAGQIVTGPWNAQWQALWPTLLPELAAHRPAHPAAHDAGEEHFCAINGNGHFIPAVPCGPDGQRMWLSGSTYEHDAAANPQATALGVSTNVQRLQQLIPAATDLLAQQHRAGHLQGWAGNRCTTRERLPVVGAVSAEQAPGLYACTAMSSRGLSFAALCGQHLASLITAADDSPMPSHLQRAISPAA
jgi:tRNA 5-methylaminomethyl-2-thiouridine biosynthesis bifunctional protein